MKNKLFFLIKQSMKKKMDTKWFKVINIVLLVLMIGIINIDKIITAFGGDFNDKITIKVIDNTNSYEAFETSFEAYKEAIKNQSNYEFELVTDKEKEVDELENTSDILVEINSSDTEVMVASITSYDVLNDTDYQMILTSLSTVKNSLALSKAGLDEQTLTNMSTPIKLDQITTNPDLDDDAEAKENLAGMLILVFIIPFFFLVVLLVQMVGAEINDEKTTKSMEIIISNVSPKTHFLSKIMAGTGFVICQGALFLLYTGIAYLLRQFAFSGLGSASNDFINEIKDVLNMLVDSGILVSLAKASWIILLIFLFNFVAYALVAGILASMTTSIEDYQQLQTPLMLILVAGYYIAIMSSMFNGAVFIKAISFVPLLSPMVAPVLFLMGQTSIWELLISLGVSIVFCLLLIRYGLRVYKVGILNYSSKDLWKKIFKSMKNKEN